MSSARLKTVRLLRQATWVACFFIGLCAGPSFAAAQSRQPRPPPQYVQLGKPDQAKGAGILEEFRAKGLYAGDNYFEFELKVLPRRGKATTIPGRLWTGDKDGRPVSRIVLRPGQAEGELRLLVGSGVEGRAWLWKAGAPAVQPVTPAALFEELAGSNVTAFDLQMSYLSWDEFVYEGVSKVRGRPADTFLMYPPGNVSEAAPELTGVRVYLDAQYGAPVQAEYIGTDGKTARSVAVLDLKRIDEQWFVKSIDFRDEKTRDKTRFALVGAAVHLEFSPSLFEADTLGQAIRPPPAERIQRVGP